LSPEADHQVVGTRWSVAIITVHCCTCMAGHSVSMY